MLAHSFDRFYIVTKFILPSIGDLNFSKLNYEKYICIFRQHEHTRYQNKETYVTSYDILQKDRTICGLLQKTDKVIQQHGSYHLGK